MKDSGLLSGIKRRIYGFLGVSSGEMEDRKRSVVVVKNSTYSFIAKVFIMLMGFLTMPIVFNSLDRYQFGVYATLTSIISWIDTFDFGITQGLRNRLTESITEGDKHKSKKLIATSYFLLFIIALVIFIAYCIFYKQINWQTILNAKDLERSYLDTMAFIVLTLFLIRFVASVITKVFYAFQQSFLVEMCSLVSKVVYFIIVIVLSKNGNLTLMNVAVYQSALSVIIPVLAAVYFFSFMHRDYFFSFKDIDLSISNQILGLGWQFFVIQVALLIIHSGNNLLISQFVDPASVSSYSLSYQLLSYIMIVYVIIITPLWSAYTEAWKLDRVEWIKSTIKRIKTVFFSFAAVCLFIVLLSPVIFRLWIGEKADVPMIMAFAVAVMVLLDMWTRIFDYFINGVGMIRIQMIITVCMALFNIPLAYLFSVVCNLGAIGVVLATIVSYSVSAVISPIQAKMILNKQAKGLWAK